MDKEGIMELRTLRSFLAIAREGNVTRAAHSLHITQPALSRQMAELERDFGCELFIREPRGVTLTEEGMLLRKRAEEIVSLADRTELEMRTPAADIAGEVWIGGGESRAIETVARAAASLARVHPGVRLRMHSGNSIDVFERMEKGLLDFGVVMGAEPSSGYEVMQLDWSDVWGVLMPHDHQLAERESISLKELRDWPLIVSSQGQEVATPSQSLTFYEDRGLTVVATYTLLYNASLMVEAGLGIAVCFDGIVPAGEGTPFVFVPISDMPKIPSYLTWKRGQPLSRAARAFLDAVHQDQAGA